MLTIDTYQNQDGRFHAEILDSEGKILHATRTKMDRTAAKNAAIKQIGYLQLAKNKGWKHGRDWQ